MRFHGKGFISLLLGTALVLLAFSGAVLYASPRGRMVNWRGWTVLGLGKQDWQAIHMNLALLFLIVAGIHLYLNWRVFWCYLKRQGGLALNLKLEMLLAVLLVGAVLAGAIYRVPPFGTLVDWNYRIKDYWERGEPAASPASDEDPTQPKGHGKGKQGSGGQKKGQGWRGGRGGEAPPE
jgi:hypothetical protein